MTTPALSIPDEPRLGVSDICRRLVLHRTTVAELIASGQLRAVKVGKRWFSYPSWINEYLLSQQNVVSPDAGDSPVGSPSAAPPVSAEEVEHIHQMATEHGVAFA